MTNVQWHLLRLIQEIDELCNDSKGEIEYFLADYLALAAFRGEGFPKKAYQACLMMSEASFIAFQKTSIQRFGDARCFEKLDALHYRYVDNSSLLLDINVDVPWSYHGVAIDIKILQSVNEDRSWVRYEHPNGKIIKLPSKHFSAKSVSVFEGVPLPRVADIDFYMSVLCGRNWYTRKWPYVVRTESTKTFYDPVIPWKHFIERSEVAQFVGPDYKTAALNYNRKRRRRNAALDKVGGYRLLVDLTGDRFDYWERLYPRKAEVLKLAAENDLEALTMILRPYLERLEWYWKQGLTLVFDVDIFEAIKPLLQKRFGVNFLKKFTSAIPQEHEESISDYLRRQGVRHPLLAEDPEHLSFNPIDCEITSLSWRADNIEFSCRLKGAHLENDVMFSLEDDATGIPLIQIPCMGRRKSAEEISIDFGLDLKSVSDACVAQELIEKRKVRALRFILRIGKSSTRLVFGHKRVSGVFGNFISSAYQNEQVVLIPEEIDHGNLVFWLLPSQADALCTSVCGSPKARTKRPLLSGFLTRALEDLDFTAAHELLIDRSYLQHIDFFYHGADILASWGPENGKCLLETNATHLMQFQTPTLVRAGEKYFLKGPQADPIQSDIPAGFSGNILLQSLSAPCRIIGITIMNDYFKVLLVKKHEQFISYRVSADRAQSLDQKQGQKLVLGDELWRAYIKVTFIGSTRLFSLPAICSKNNHSLVDLK